jgi:hypothetical protein
MLAGMLPAGFSLQFSINDAYQGLAVVNGIVQTSETELILEYETKDAVVGVVKSGIKRVRIPDDQLASVALKAGWFSTKLLIRTKGMAALAGVPGNEAGQVVLRVARKDRRAAAELVSAVLLHLSEKQLASLSRALRQ